VPRRAAAVWPAVDKTGGWGQTRSAIGGKPGSGADKEATVKVPTRWLAFLLAGSVLAAVSVSVSCAGGATPTGDTSLITVETSQVFITVKNQAGQALRNVHVSIVPIGGSTLFTTTISRLESGEKRDLSLAQFQGRDGTPFNLRVIKPKTVRVSGTNIEDKTVEVEVPWRQ
jgi:hypothetical protein